MNTTTLVRCLKKPVIGFFAERILMLMGVCINRKTKIGNNVSFPHNAVGTVINTNAVIEDNVKIYQGVTIGRKDPTNTDPNEGALIKKGVILCAGAKILSGNKQIVVGENTIIAANAVLLSSTGDNEIWGGIPAKK